MVSAAVASARMPASPARRPDVEEVWAALADVADPEIPAVSVVDLGIVHAVDLDADHVRVQILPTFLGCPAIDAIRDAIADRLTGMAPRVEVEVTFAVPWTSERITPEGRRRLTESGFAPPSGAATMPMPLIPLLPVTRAATCPFCGSQRTSMDNAFGPTLCRSIHYCIDCRQPFEQFKDV